MTTMFVWSVAPTRGVVARSDLITPPPPTHFARQCSALVHDEAENTGFRRADFVLVTRDPQALMRDPI